MTDTPRRLALGAALLVAAAHALAAEAAPLPQPRPALSAPAPVGGRDMPEQPPVPKAKPAEAAPAAPPDPAPQPVDAGAEIACRGRLIELGVAYEELQPIDGPGACGAAAPIRVSGLGGGIGLEPPATLTCPMAEALARWAQQAVLPAAERHLHAAPTGIVNAASYVCRTRNSRPGARLSEHAMANAIDIGGFAFAGDEAVPILLRGDDEARERAFQRAVRRAACRHFTTVIGPGTDAAHADHFHLDLAKRRGGYRLCQ